MTIDQWLRDATEDAERREMHGLVPRLGDGISVSVKSR
jgi:hypothetical protein